MVRRIIVSILLAAHVVSAAAAAAEPVRNPTKGHRKRHAAHKTSYEQSKDAALSLTREEQQIMAARNKADALSPKKRPESAYDKAVKSIDDYISGGRPKRNTP